MTNPLRRFALLTGSPRGTLRRHRPLLAAVLVLGALVTTTGADAQQPVVQQQSSTVRQTTTTSATTIGDGSRSQASTQVAQNSASTTQANTSQGSTQRVSTSQASVAQGATTQSSTVSTSTPPGSVSHTTVAPGATTASAAAGGAARPTESLQLLAGCSNVALSWAVGTPLAAVAAAVDPPHALAAIFKQDAAAGRYRGYSPTAPAFANDYTAVEAPLEAVFVCVNQGATLARPTS
jgi:hypothetical protein